MKSFARVTKLSNIGGRADYISNPERQENIVALSPAVDWKPYHDYERTHQRTDTANNEGREVVVSLPNEWERLTHGELETRAQALAVTAAGKATDMQWAVHWNKAHTNLHLHVIFSERQREKNVGKYDRDIYLTNEGKVARRKADRATDASGKVKPPVHRKGEEQGDFTAKDTRYKSRAWVHTMKEDLRQELTRLGASIEKPAPLYQYHEGKGKEAPRIAEKNVVIRENNERLKALEKAGYNAQRAKETMIKLHGEKRLPVLYLKDGIPQITHFITPSKAVELMERTKDTIPEPSREAPARPAAPISEPTPETRSTAPPFSFTALIEAQREFYRQTYALNDTRTPLNNAVVNAPAECKQALKDLEAARKNLSAAQYERSKCHFWQRDEKTAADAKIKKAANDSKVAFDTLKKHGVSAYRDNSEMNGRNLSDDDMKCIRDRTKWQIDDLQRKADYEARFALPDDALKGSQDAQNAARERFTSLCREIPPDRRKETVEALKAALQDDKKGAVGIGAMRAIEAVQRVVNKELPQERDLSRTHQRGRSR